jgi:hypothetical protein
MMIAIAMVLALPFDSWVMALAQGRQDPSADMKERWVYCSFNLWVDKNIETLEGILKRASKAGYTHVLIADSKFGKLGDMDARYFKNVDRVKKLASELKLDLVPAVFPVGYSEAILWHDPNLAEALQARDVPFVVKDGAARPVAEASLPPLDQWDWKDECVKVEGGVATMSDPGGKNARIVRKLKLPRYRAYHVAVRVKADDWRGEVRVNVLAAGGRALVYSHLGVKRSQEWTEHHAVFNTLDHEEVTIYLGSWGGKGGTLAWKDVRLEELGLSNVVRRDGAPLVVMTGDGSALVEGKNYDKVVDARCGTVPWKGGYEVWHEPVAIKTSLADGTKLRVSYHHVVTVYDGQVMICPSEPKTVELLRDQAKRMHAAWGAKAYFMSHDEIRVMNQDDACVRRKMDAGAILADNARTCVSILREVNPGGRVYVWSDMFDPNHNAKKDYYLVRGDLAGAWEGLDKDVIIAAWYYEKRRESLRWFRERGHRLLIAGYYDSAPENVRGWVEAGREAGGVDGVMYTTWENKWSDLERFAEILGEK